MCYLIWSPVVHYIRHYIRHYTTLHYRPVYASSRSLLKELYNITTVVNTSIYQCTWYTLYYQHPTTYIPPYTLLLAVGLL